MEGSLDVIGCKGCHRSIKAESRGCSWCFIFTSFVPSLSLSLCLSLWLWGENVFAWMGIRHGDQSVQRRGCCSRRRLGARVSLSSRHRACPGAWRRLGTFVAASVLLLSLPLRSSSAAFSRPTNPLWLWVRWLFPAQPFDHEQRAWKQAGFRQYVTLLL